MSTRAENDQGGLMREAQTELVRNVQRVWILSAMASVVCEHGPEMPSVRVVTERAGVSRRRFYELFSGSDDCFRAVFEEVVAQADERARAGYRIDGTWTERVRSALCAVLDFLDCEPELARVALLYARPKGPVSGRREEVIAQLAQALDASVREDAPPVVLLPASSQAIVSGVLDAIRGHLLQASPDSLRVLLNPLMGMIVAPYLGAEAARRELSRDGGGRMTAPRRCESPPRKRAPLDRLNMRLTYRTLRVLAEVAAAPGISNRAVAAAAGVSDRGQISKLLSRMEGLGLVRNLRAGPRCGIANAWVVTSRGAEVGRAAAPALGWGPASKPREA